MKQKTQIIVDDTLTLENAKERGYIWVQDKIYSPEIDDQDINREFYEYMAKGYKLGTPASPALVENQGVGVYISIDEYHEQMKEEATEQDKK